MKPKKIKARKMWGGPKLANVYLLRKHAEYYSGFSASKVAPKFVLPADAASVERMVEQIRERWDDGTTPCSAKDLAIAALAAIGIGGAK